MKKLLTFAIGLLVVATARADVVWQAEPPANVPDKVPLVQVFPTPVSRDMMLRQAADLGMPREGQFIKTPVGLALQSGNFVLQTNSLGSSFFADTSLYMNGKPDLDPIPDSRAASAARAFLGKQYPGILAEATQGDVQHLMSQAQDIATGGLSNVTQDESIVLFSRSLAGIPVVGPGDKSRVHVANDGSITGVQNVWRNTAIIAVLIGLLKYDQVKDTFLRQLQSEMGDGSVRVFVTGIQFGYYSRPENQPQGWYQPCYLFSVSFFNNKQQQITGARLIPIPAMDPARMKEPLELPQDPPNNGDPSRILFGDVKAPDLPRSAALIPIAPSAPNADKMLSRLRLLGDVGGSVDQNPRGLVAASTDGKTVLYQDTNGAEFFGHLDRFLNETPGEAKPLSDAVAIRLAQAWLDKMGDMDPAQVGLPAVQHLFQQSYDLKTKTENPPTQDETIVTFPRQIPTATGAPAIPLIGQGTGIQVHVDNVGNITGHRRVWRNLRDPGPAEDILPYLDIQSAFVRQLTPDLGDFVAKVTGIQFGYFGRPEGFQQGWLLPAVLYDVDLIDPSTGEVTAHRQIPIPATANQPEDLEDPTATNNPPVEEDTRSADTVPTLYGDIDGDGQVTTTDAALAMKMYGGMDSASDVPPAQMVAGDVAPQGGADGQIAMNDALRILRSIFQLDNISNGP